MNNALNCKANYSEQLNKQDVRVNYKSKTLRIFNQHVSTL